MSVRNLGNSKPNSLLSLKHDQNSCKRLEELPSNNLGKKYLPHKTQVALSFDSEFWPHLSKCNESFEIIETGPINTILGIPKVSKGGRKPTVTVIWDAV